MILTVHEFLTNTYACPYCHAIGNLREPRSPEPLGPQTPKATLPIFRDSDGRDYHRVYLDGGPPPPDGSIPRKAQCESESKANAEETPEDGRTREDSQAQEGRKRVEDPPTQLTVTREDKPKEPAQPIAPEEEPIPKDAHWDQSFDDLESDYWEWFFDRRHSLSFGEPSTHYDQDKDE